jgi:hypothetical protein
MVRLSTDELPDAVLCAIPDSNDTENPIGGGGIWRCE